MHRFFGVVLLSVGAAAAAPAWSQDTGTTKKIRELNEIVLVC